MNPKRAPIADHGSRRPFRLSLRQKAEARPRREQRRLVDKN
jgi:hypothetical protein